VSNNNLMSVEKQIIYVRINKCIYLFFIILISYLYKITSVMFIFLLIPILIYETPIDRKNFAKNICFL